MMKTHLIGSNLPMWMAVLIILVSLPLVMQKVRLNPFYGFRTPKTMSNPQIWYKANRLAGINMIFAGVLTLIAWGIIGLLFGATKANLIGLPVFMVLLLGSLVVSLLQLRKM